jgi:hypothetical protein
VSAASHKLKPHETSHTLRLGVALDHFGLEHLPYLAVQVVERLIELDLGDIARRASSATGR